MRALLIVPLFLLAFSLPAHADDPPLPPVAYGTENLDGTFTISWIPPSGPLGPAFDGFNVYRLVNGQVSLLLSTSGAARSATDTARPADQLIQYVVTWVHGNQESLPSNPVDGSRWPHCSVLSGDENLPPREDVDPTCLFPLPGT